MVVNHAMDGDDPNFGFNRMMNSYSLGGLPAYYQPVVDNIELTKFTDFPDLNMVQLRNHYIGNIGKVDELVQNVLSASDSDSLESQINILQRMGTNPDLEDISSQFDKVIEGELIDKARKHIDQQTINKLADYENLRAWNGVPLYPAALLAGGIGAGLAGLNPYQSIATGVAATAAIPITDAILNNPSLRKYKATIGIRPAAATLTGILTALGFKTLSPEQDQELLDKGMQYAQQQNGGVS